MTIRETISKYAKQLKSVTDIPYKEVEILILFILQKDNVWLHCNYDNLFEYQERLDKLIQKRIQHYPIEYITNKVSFYSEEFWIEEGVLIPRPETELLIDNAIDILKGIKNPKILEIGSGSGVISIILAKHFPNSDILSVDINKTAIKIAQKNSEIFKTSNIEFRYSDMFCDIDNLDFDMIISNPPYIKDSYKLPKNLHYEPSNALFGGQEGDEMIKQIIDTFISSEILYFICEIGYDQKESISKYVENADEISIKFYQDYSGFDRGFIMIKTTL